jgi:hypothetical protein
MATKLNDNEPITFRKLLISNEIYTEPLVQLLIEKGFLTKGELLGRIKQMQMGMVKAQT